MATASRLRGNVPPIFTLKKGAAAAVSYADDLKSWELTNDDADDSDLTFAEAAAGLAATWTLSLTAVMSYDAGALFAFLMDNPNTDVVVVLGPWGNATATATKPHFSATFNTGRPPGFSNEARLASNPQGAEFTHELTAQNVTLSKITS